MESVASAMDELCIGKDPNCRSRGRTGRKRCYDDGTREYKSKNLEAERKRRQKLSDRLLALRSLVPIITNINKATIVEDAITYIKELQNKVDVLTDRLAQMEVAEVEAQTPKIVETEKREEMEEERVIQEEVSVTQIHGNKLWAKIILEKKRGRFSELVHVMNDFGFEFIDTNVTSAKGAFLISATIQGPYGETRSVQKTKDILQDIVNGI